MTKQKKFITCDGNQAATSENIYEICAQKLQLFILSPHLLQWLNM